MTRFKIAAFILVFTWIVTLKDFAYPMPTIDEYPGDNYYPMTSIVDKKLTDLVFLNNATVKGGGVNDEHGVLSLTGSGYVAFEGYANDCLMDPTNCVNGFTVSFWMRHGAIISSILGFNSKYQTALDNWLSPIIPSKSRWTRCYRASKHGWKGSVFQAKCKGRDKTLTIVKVRDYVFGGFLSARWSLAPIIDPKAFLFSLNNPLDTEPFKLSQKSGKGKAASLMSMPSFGDGDLVLADHANTNTQSTTKPGITYQIPGNIPSTNPSNLLAGSSPFLVDEIEVFYNTELFTNQSYILTSGADNSSKTGFAIYSSHDGQTGRSLSAKVVTKNKIWKVSAKNLTKAWQHVAITWSSYSGIKLYKDGSVVTNSKATVYSATSKETKLLIGSSSSSQYTSQNLQMYGLILWRKVASQVEINKYKNTAYSPMTNKGDSSFIWYSKKYNNLAVLKTGPLNAIYYGTPTSPTLNLTNAASSAEVEVNNIINVFTVCWQHRNDIKKDVGYNHVVLHIRDHKSTMKIYFSRYGNAFKITTSSSLWKYKKTNIYNKVYNKSISRKCHAARQHDLSNCDVIHRTRMPSFLL